MARASRWWNTTPRSKRLQEAQQSINKVTTPQEQKDRVIDNFVTEMLMAQAAVQNGKVLDDTDLQNRINALITDIGGEDKLTAWQARNGYTPETFRASLRRSILVSWQRDEIINAVPTTADQIHARQILVQDEDNAAYAYAQLQTGADFETLAFDYDPLLGGDLFWFPRGDADPAECGGCRLCAPARAIQRSHQE